MKKGIKKIAVLATVAIMTLSSMSVIAAETRAAGCPNVCGGTFSIQSKTLVSKDIIGTKECPYDENGIDFIDLYTYNVIYRCTNCNYAEFKQVQERIPRCSHK